MRIFEQLEALRKDGTQVALVTVVRTSGSTPRKPGCRMLIFADGHTEGSIGGGAVEHLVKEAAQRVLKTTVPELVEHRLTTDLAMCCGGQMTFFVEPVMSNPSLIVFGCGHVGSALIYAASPLGFDITAIDDLDENANTDRLPHAKQIINSYEPADLDSLPFGDDCYVVIATREHSLDQKLLEFCIDKQSAYLGVIGSPRKAKMQLERMRSKSVAEQSLERVRCPVGLDIGALTPEEIAVAVCAEMIQIRRGGNRFDRE